MHITGNRASHIIADDIGAAGARVRTKLAAYDLDGIWGAGDTEEQARAGAEGFIRSQFADAYDAAAERTIRGLKVAPIDDALLADVHECGAPYDFFAIADGVLVPADEPFAEDLAASLMDGVL